MREKTYHNVLYMVTLFFMVKFKQPQLPVFYRKMYIFYFIYLFFYSVLCSVSIDVKAVTPHANSYLELIFYIPKLRLTAQHIQMYGREICTHSTTWNIQLCVCTVGFTT